MQIRVNGKNTEVGDDISLRDYLEANNLPADRVLAAIDDKIIQPQDYDIKLHENAKVELMTFVPGG